MTGLAPRSAPTDTRTEREALAVVASVDGVGPAGLMRLVARHGSAAAAIAIALGPSGAHDLVDASRGSPVRRDWLAPEVADLLVRAARNTDAIVRRMHALNVDVLLWSDAGYPSRLLTIEEPPPILFVRGDVACLDPPHPIAVVGTRYPTLAGLRLATEIADLVTAAGGTIVSGLALGIDGASHEAAVRLDRPTIAVIGSGHGQLYPASHRSLADRIVAAGGCVLSELAPDTSGSRGTFPRRNRLISGMSDATVVVEAPLKSGALITARHALLQGRECFLVPGPVGAYPTAGSLLLLRDNVGQARIVASVPTLLEDLGFRTAVTPATAPSALGLGDTEGTLARSLADGTDTVDGLVAATGLAVSTVLSGLTLLEMRGLVVGAYGRYRVTGALVPQIAATPARPSTRQERRDLGEGRDPGARRSVE